MAFLTAREIMIKSMQAKMLGDYGHDLPPDHFAGEVDRILDDLNDAGFAIFWNGQAAAQGGYGKK